MSKTLAACVVGLGIAAAGPGLLGVHAAGLHGASPGR